MVTGYFIEAVFQFKNCSRLVRLDMGTENVDIARMQALMSGDSSFLVGRGTHNQCIQIVWCILRKEARTSFGSIHSDLLKTSGT